MSCATPQTPNLLDAGHDPVVSKSALDLSVNFVWNLGAGRALEARYVRRIDEYFIAYLSSHTGCNQACRFCHLTATKQVSFDDATVEDYLRQAAAVIDYYAEEVRAGRQAAAKRVNFNWMARGEPLLNPAMATRARELLTRLTELAAAQGITCIFNVSSIVPVDAELSALEELMAFPTVQLYYSLYSLEPRFRKRWLPKARDPRDVIRWLADVQARHGTLVALHWAVIDGENDQEAGIQAISDLVRESGLVSKFNLVRYNPYSEAQGREAGEQAIRTTFAIMSQNAHTESRIVPRVGSDVKASCGMFVDAR